MGVSDNVVSEYSYVIDYETNISTVYKGKKAVFQTEHYIDQIEGGFLEYTDEGLIAYDMNFNKLHCFPEEYSSVMDGHDGVASCSGYLMFRKDNMYILCTKDGTELISMDKWFEVLLEGEYFRVSVYGNPDTLYDLHGNYVEDVENRAYETTDYPEFICTAFYNDNSYYRRYYAGWFEFISNDFEYSLPYNIDGYFATYYFPA